MALGQLRPAEAAVQEGLRLAPDHADILTDYGHLLCQMRRPDQAIQMLERALERDPRHVRASVGLAIALGLLDRWEHAATACRAALAADPRHRDARNMLAIADIRLWNLAEAEANVHELLQDYPRDASLWALLGNVLSKAGRSEEALDAFRQSLQIQPDAAIHSTMLLSSLYTDELSPHDLLRAHREWDKRYAQPLMPRDAPVARPLGGRKLRIGFVSLDFAQHPIGFLALPAIEALDRDECAVVCYCDRLGEDEYTARFRRAADVWRLTGELTPEELAAQIRGDQIDILVDLMGHTGQRLRVFARRPAPLQIAWLGYASTTGMEAIDCLLADRFHVAPGEEVQFSERVLRMPHSYACYRPPDACPEVAPLPAIVAGRVTFGCFNNPAKYTPHMLAAWAEILRRVPDSQLMLKAGGLDQPAAVKRLLVNFAERGIARERILFEGWSPSRDLLASYNRVDLALDTQPYSGGLTTCEALWMGVPVITIPGQRLASRHSTSYLASVGCQQFVAGDLPGYIELATSWAGRHEALAAVRAGLREQLRASPVCDAPRFARDLLHLLRQEWERRAALAARQESGA
jgi:predicted O-linked N-acetylglucosamine transferase (SPINDLY family)